MTQSFDALATVSASTKRNPAAVEGKIGAAATNLSSINILPLMPVSPETRAMYGLSSPREVKETYTAGSDTDIEEGDVLLAASDEYRIVAVAEWSHGTMDYLQLIVEEVKGT